MTLTLPMQSVHKCNNNPIRSFEFNFQFLMPMSISHPSGRRPSKKGNKVSETYASSRFGSVKLMGLFFSFARYVEAYLNEYSPSDDSISIPANKSLTKI